MSVQLGMWNFDGKPVTQGVLDRFSGCLRSRPDGESRFVQDGFAMVYRPFHTTPESACERQPFTSGNGLVITWDGRLDNRDDLIAALQLDVGAIITDIELVAAAFEKSGTDCLSRIAGDWALSVWDSRQRTLVLAADYMAIRHIFYHGTHDCIRWSTDLGLLLLSTDQRLRLNDSYIAGYFANEPEGHLTPYEGIYQVPPGHYVRVQNRSSSAKRHWHFNRKQIRYKNDCEYEEHFRSIFKQSVRRRLRSDSIILAELSGGLDSSSIVCVADDIMERGEAHAPGLDTISYYDNTEPNGDDWQYLHIVERRRGRSGLHIDTSRWGQGSGLRYPTFVPLPGHLGLTFHIEQDRADLIRKGGYRIVLSGIGGDEFLGGVPAHTMQLADLLVQFRLMSFGKQLFTWSLAKRRPWIHLLGQTVADLLPASIVVALKSQGSESWIKRDFDRRNRIAARQIEVSEQLGTWLPSRRFLLGGVILMGNKLAKSTCSPLLPEEVRYPFLDRDLVEFLLSVPANQLQRPGERRSLMRRALKGLVPHEILSRSTKQAGARTPVVALDQCWPELQNVFNRSLSSALGYIDDCCFLNELDEARYGRYINIVRMLKAISLEYWLRDLAERDLIECPQGFSRGLRREPLCVT